MTECYACAECSFCGIDANDLPLPRRMICAVCYEGSFPEMGVDRKNHICVMGVDWVRSGGEWHSVIRGRIASQEGTPEELHDAYEYISTREAQLGALRGDTVRKTRGVMEAHDGRADTEKAP